MPVRLPSALLADFKADSRIHRRVSSHYITGIVLDGPIRDIDEIGKWDFPVYCTGTTPGGPYKEGPGEVNVPVSCGGVSVNPGDIILADPDGVIVIPRKDAPQI